MPHIPDSQHDTHDLALIAAFAADDVSGPDLATAASLVAACPDCAAVDADIRAIMAALPSVPAPVRTRDFRISAAQAASLRPTGWRAALAALAAPRFSFAAPLGTGLAALGIVGVLVASGGLATGSGATAGAAPGATDQRATSIEAAPQVQALDDASMAPAASSTDPDLSLKSGPAGIAGTGPAEGPPAGTGPDTTVAAAGGSSPLQVAGVLLVVVGLGLVAMRLVARRFAGAP